MASFDDFLHSLKIGISDLGERTINDLKDQAVNDAEAFIDDANEDLKKWTKQLADGEMSQDEFEFLLKAKKDVFVLHALTQAGVLLVTIQKFRDAVIDLVISTAVDMFL